jgi:phosphinothricin acetyltransferase
MNSEHPATAASDTHPSHSFTVRGSADADMDQVHAIYAHHVCHGLASWEEEPPTLDEMRARRAQVLKLGLPYIVAEEGGAILGYSYAGTYRPRPGYRYSVENSVYVAERSMGRGVGRALLRELIARCEKGPWRQMLAVIGDSANDASIALHLDAGFERVGTFRSIGFKQGRWLDSVLMQRALGDGDRSLPESTAR